MSQSGLIAALILSLCITVVPPSLSAATWRNEFEEIRLGIVAGEDPNQVERFENYRKLLADHLGVPVRIYPAMDYKVLLQAHARADVHLGFYTAQAYAAAWLSCQCVVPLVAPRGPDGSRGYVSVMIVRTGTPLQGPSDLHGKSVAWSDPSSTFGYRFPAAILRSQGHNPSDLFGKSGFVGSHKNVVEAVASGLFDAGFTWGNSNGQLDRVRYDSTVEIVGDKNQDLSHVKTAWVSPLLPNGPIAVAATVHGELKRELIQFHLDLQKRHPDTYKEIEPEATGGYDHAGHELFTQIVDLCRESLPCP